MTSATPTLALDASRRAEALFVVASRRSRPSTAQLRVAALDAMQAEWLALDGEPVRDFSPEQSQMFKVAVCVPSGVSGGRYRFRLDVLARDDPDQDFTLGPPIEVRVPDLGLAPLHYRLSFWAILAAGVVALVAWVVGKLA